ncbi:hypothetical protein [Oleiharenicola lentus]|uniref:hypothetical protein n=1 Tax=Oleiharenicola lentus TaxID=2508720 RepID=UPI003F67AF8F
MPKPVIQFTEEEQSARIDAVGLEKWQASQREDAHPFAEALASSQSADVLRALMQVCLPPKTFGNKRRFRSGYFRMVAFVWRLSPELLEPCRYDQDVAELLGISREALLKHLEKIDALLGRETKRPKL